MSFPNQSDAGQLETSFLCEGELTCQALRQLHLVPDDVRALFAQSERLDPQFGLAWFQNLADAVYPGDAGVVLHVLRLNDQPIAAIPLRVDVARLGRKAQALGNFYTCLYAPALAQQLTPEQLAMLFIDIKAVHAPLASIALSPLDGQSPGLSLLKRALSLAGMSTYEHRAFGNWYLPVLGTFEQYLADRPGEVRNTLRRSAKKFAAVGGRLQIVDRIEDVATAMAAYVEVYNASWKRAEPFESFMPGLAGLCASREWLRLGLAWVGQKPVAAQFWIVCEGKAHIYKLAYAPDFKHLSPGSLLTAKLMQRAIEEDRVVEIDYMKGDDGYKNQWMTHRRERVGVLAFNPRTAFGLLGAAREAAAQALAAWKLKTHSTAAGPIGERLSQS